MRSVLFACAASLVACSVTTAFAAPPPRDADDRDGPRREHRRPEGRGEDRDDRDAPRHEGRGKACVTSVTRAKGLLRVKLLQSIDIITLEYTL